MNSADVEMIKKFESTNEMSIEEMLEQFDSLKDDRVSFLCVSDGIDDETNQIYLSDIQALNKAIALIKEHF